MKKKWVEPDTRTGWVWECDGLLRESMFDEKQKYFDGKSVKARIIRESDYRKLVRQARKGAG